MTVPLFIQTGLTRDLFLQSLQLLFLIFHSFFGLTEILGGLVKERGGNKKKQKERGCGSAIQWLCFPSLYLLAPHASLLCSFN